MYVWIWRHLPGPLLARAAQSVLLLAAVVGVLFLWVFPEVESRLPYQDVTVPVGPSSTGAPDTPGFDVAPSTPSESTRSQSTSPAPSTPSLAPTVGPRINPTPPR